MGQNILTVARLMTVAALRREESRGVHFRTDHPEPDPKRDGQHLVVQRSADGLVTRPENGAADARSASS